MEEHCLCVALKDYGDDDDRLRPQDSYYLGFDYEGLIALSSFHDCEDLGFGRVCVLLLHIKVQTLLLDCFR